MTEYHHESGCRTSIPAELDARMAVSQSMLMARLTIRIDLGREASIGPGMARLLELVDERGSIRGAAIAMGMSYRRAWLLLREIEAAMGAPVIVGQVGGAKGGGTSLNALGRAVLKQYRAIEKRASRSVHAQLQVLSGLASARLEIARPGKTMKPQPRKTIAGTR